MANEYFHRTPTSSGNRKIFTYAGWFKKNNANGSDRFDIFNAYNTGTQQEEIGFRQDALRYLSSGSSLYGFDTTNKYRDTGNWFHIVFALNTTLESERKRSVVYINGVEVDTTTSSGIGAYVAKNFDSIAFNVKGKEHNVLSRKYSSSGRDYAEGGGFDIFFVDGQALTPDVFGFFKEGKGYQSSGTTKATDFRPGQWSPHSPRKIKTEIERRGGFGVNGFYLPMNDSSNFGADFHCTPNSIIKLKGEDLPQPRNGLPTTSDNYVSQLRSDPYAANLVLAVPGVNTQPTGSELVTNGTFDTDVSGWTVTDTGTIVRQSDGTAKVTRGSSAEVVYQDITTVVGTTYELSVDITDIAGSHGQVYVKSTYHSGSLNTNIGYSFYTGTFRGTFTADTTTTRITLYAHPSGSTSYDNISVKETTIPDYSASIKGSGTNKTSTVNGAAGIRNNDVSGSAVNGYYGSAYSSNSNNDSLEFPGTSGDFNVGTGDFTIEMWLNPNSTQPTNARLFGQDGNSAENWDVYIAGTSPSSRIRMMGGLQNLTGGNGSSYGNLVGDQWNHFCLERYNGQLTTYVNGVAVYTQSYTSSIGDNNPFRIGQIGSNVYSGVGYGFNGEIQDFRFYKGVAKYKGGFDVPKPYSPIGIESWRQVPDTCKNNFATLNPLDAVTDNQSGTDYTQATHSNGNLTVILSDDFSSARGSIGISTGKYYWEIRVDDNYSAVGMGVIAPGNQLTSYHSGANGASYEPRGDRFRKNGVTSYDGTNNKTDDGLIVGVALDKNVGIVSFFADGTLLSNGTMTGLNALSDVHIPECFTYNDGSNVDNTYTWNFGQNPTFCGQVTAGTNADASGKGLFKYAPPTGFLALCEDNLPTPAIADPGEHFKTVLWTGDGRSYRSITGVGFAPDFVWIKVRNAVNSHYLFDTIRGADKALFTDLRDNENDYNGSGDGRMPSFDSDGFTVSYSSSTGTNESDDDYVAWCWKAGGPAVTNNDGSIAAQISVNQDAGFSILSYTGNGTSGTVGHGLGKTPNIVICKNRSDDLTNWSFNGNVAGLIYGTNKMVLQGSGGIISDTNEVTSANATTITLGNSSATNDTNDAQIAYCWTEISGFSKFGSYTGTGGSDGPFVYCGFKPAFLMIKRTDALGEWWMYDSSRGSTNPIPRMLMANFNVVEEEDSASYLLDFVSNGFKWRSGLDASNGDGNTYLFMAFAESPFQTANAK